MNQPSKPRTEESNNAVQSLGLWILDKLTLVTRPSPHATEQALAAAVSRKHEEEMRHKALELSLGIRPYNPKGQWQ